MKVETYGQIITALVYDQKDKETKEKTGKQGLMISLLVDVDEDKHLSGRVISPYVDPEEYKGILDFSNVDVLDVVKITIDVPSDPRRGLWLLYDLQLIKK